MKEGFTVISAGAGLAVVFPALMKSYLETKFGAI
jgi:hypothetical protein